MTEIFAALVLAYIPAGLTILAGLLIATYAGGPLVAWIVSRWSQQFSNDGLKDAGRMIGLLERAIIFMLVLAGQPAGIGFLIAAKSILRFETTSQDQKTSEYVIVGTLASFGWAMAVSFATQALLQHLDTLGIGGGPP